MSWASIIHISLSMSTFFLCSYLESRSLSFAYSIQLLFSSKVLKSSTFSQNKNNKNGMVRLVTAIAHFLRAAAILYNKDFMTEAAYKRKTLIWLMDPHSLGG